MGLLIHGIASSQNIDSSGEIVNIDGLDISSLAVDGVFNYEHEQGKIPDKDGKPVELQIKVPSQVVGKILKAHKILSEEDCQNEHQLYFWNKIKVPYVYVMGELLNEYTDAAKDLAGKFRYDADNKLKNERSINSFSIEGSKIEKKGIEVTKSIARRVTVTTIPCNKMAIAEMIPIRTPNDINSLFKTEPTEIEVLKVESNNTPVEILEKALTLGNSNVAPGQLVGGAALNKENLLKNKISPSHPNHPSDADVSYMLSDAPSTKTSPSKSPAKPIVSTPASAKPKATPKISVKPPTEGSRVNTKYGRMTYQYTSVPKASPTKTTKPIIKKEKSKKLLRAEEEYNKWNKKEEFRGFMKKRMPHLAMGEIDAIGKMMVLNKSIAMEASLANLCQEDTFAIINKKENKEVYFDPNELKMGIEVEMEHTDDPKVAEKIAKEHLVEHPKYYSTLKQCFGEE